MILDKSAYSKEGFKFPKQEILPYEKEAIKIAMAGALVSAIVCVYIVILFYCMLE